VFTDLESGKVKRIRNDPRATLSSSDFRGRPKGGSVRAEARILDRAGGEVADRALREKYGRRRRRSGSSVSPPGEHSSSLVRRGLRRLRPGSGRPCGPGTESSLFTGLPLRADLAQDVGLMRQVTR
jgi:PPOX class probable F420-dependent enzyme